MITTNNTSSSNINVTSPALPSAQTASIWLGAFAVLGFLIVVVNMLTIAGIVLKSRFRMYCIVNLAIADVLRGILSPTYQIYYFMLYIDDPYEEEHDSHVLHDLTDAALFPVFLSLFSLVLIAIERVFAAFFPIRYRNSTLKKHYLVAFGITWGLALLVSLFFHFHDHHFENESALQTFFSTVVKSIIFLSLALIIGSYTAVFIKMHYQDKAQRQQQLPGVVIQRAKRERHLAKTVFIVTAVSLATWMPYATVLVIYTFSISFIDLFKIIPNIVSATIFINIANSLINPVVYVFRIKDIRKAVFSLVCSRCEREVDPVHTISSNNNNQPTSLPTHVMPITPRDF